MNYDDFSHDPWEIDLIWDDTAKGLEKLQATALELRDHTFSLHDRVMKLNRENADLKLQVANLEARLQSDDHRAAVADDIVNKLKEMIETINVLAGLDSREDDVVYTDESTKRA